LILQAIRSFSLLRERAHPENTARITNFGQWSCAHAVPSVQERGTKITRYVTLVHINRFLGSQIVFAVRLGTIAPIAVCSCRDFAQQVSFVT
jgi:hypothetical protein